MADSVTYSRILGTGSYLPERVLTNAELEAMVDTSDQWIRDRTGIQERRVAADGETTGDMAEQAALAAMEAAGVSPDEIDLLVLGTVHRNLPERLLLGSTAESVITRANADVLVIKPEDFQSPWINNDDDQ